jgi:hypothetical protein
MTPTAKISNSISVRQTTATTSKAFFSLIRPYMSFPPIIGQPLSQAVFIRCIEEKHNPVNDGGKFSCIIASERIFMDKKSFPLKFIRRYRYSEIARPSPVCFTLF